MASRFLSWGVAQLKAVDTSGVRAMQVFQLARQAGVLGVAIGLAHSGWSNLQVGVYEQWLFMGYLFSFIWVNGLIQGLLVRGRQLEMGERITLFRIAFLQYSGIAVGVGLLAWLGRDVAWQALLHTDAPEAWGWFLLHWGLLVPAMLQESFYLLQRAYRRLAIYGVVAGLGWMLAVLVPVYQGGSLTMVARSMAVYAFLRWVWTLVWLSQKNHLTQWFGPWKSWWRQSAPLILYAAIGALVVSSDGWVVGHIFDGDGEQFAIFRYGARELPIAVAMATAFGNALLPELSMDIGGGLLKLRQKSIRLMHVLFPVTVLLLVTSRWWFPWVFDARFESSVPLFNIYLLLLVSRMIFSHSICISLDKSWVLLRITLIEWAINLVLSLGWGWAFGLEGIVAATVVAFSAEKLMQAGYLWWWHDIPPGRYVPLGWWLGYSCTLLVAFLLINY